MKWWKLVGRHALATLSAFTLLLATGSLVDAENHAGLLETGARQDLTARDLERVRKVTQPTTDFSSAEAFETMQGGAGTSKKLVNRDSFSQFLANLTFEQEQEFKLGNALFRKLWVASPSSTQASDGLGPLFNSRSCQSCHLKDGRGHPPLAEDHVVAGAEAKSGARCEQDGPVADSGELHGFTSGLGIQCYPTESES